MNITSDNSKRFTLLYVEDEDTIRSNVENCLKYMFNVIVARNGKEGLEKFNDNGIDLVITDIVMPEIDGISMLEEIKKISPNMPTIVTSAFDKDVKIQLNSMGITKCLPKPFDIKQLVFDSMNILNK